MKLLLKLSTIFLFISILFKNLSTEETIPKFCDIPQIQGIFQYGNNIRVIYGKWVWTYDEISHQILEPPKKMSSLVNKYGIYDIIFRYFL